jgi:hypothetical protein
VCQQCLLLFGIIFQVRDGFYNFQANLAVLKLYQFNPQLFKMPIATAILLKALTNLPSTDFQLCRALIQETEVRIEKCIPNTCIDLVLGDSSRMTVSVATRRATV